MARLLAYKVMRSSDEAKQPVGSVFLARQWLGRRHVWQTYDRETMSFSPYFESRYLGPITARTDIGKLRQMIALPGTSHLRDKFKRSIRVHLHARKAARS